MNVFLSIGDGRVCGESIIEWTRAEVEWGVTGFLVFGDLSWVCGTFELKQGRKESYDRKMGLFGV